jgi:uncharacterized protein YukE
MRGKDGRQIESEVGAELDYLSQVSRRLGVADLVEDYFAPVVGDWNDLHDEAERWRAAGEAADAVTKDLLKPLGRLDSAWQGASADSFVEHMQKVGLAGHDLTDAMTAMGDALDETAEGLRGIVRDMSDAFRDTADVVSGAAGLPLDGDARIIAHLDDLREPAKEMYESVRDVLEAFLRLCDGLSGADPEFGGPTMDHRYPERNWAFAEPSKPAGTPQAMTGASAVGAGRVEVKPETAAPVGASGSSMSGTLPGGGASVGGGSVGGGVGGGSVGGGVGSAPAAAQQGPTQSGGYTAVQEPRLVDSGAPRPAAAAAGGGGSAPGGQPVGGGMMGGAPMGGGGQQGGDKEHKSKVRIAGSAEELLGKPKKSAPPVLGQD